MAEVLNFDDVRHSAISDDPGAARLVQVRDSKNGVAAEKPFSFWPEVSCDLWVTSPQPVDSANSPRRVFSEILAILGTTGIIATAISLLVSTPALK